MKVKEESEKVVLKLNIQKTKIMASGPITFMAKRWDYQSTGSASWETYMQVRKQELELDMEQQTGSK